MALLDVSDVLDDEDFTDDDLVRERRTQTVGLNGMATNATATATFTGVVVQNGGDARAVGPDGQRISGDISVFTRFDIRPGDDTHDADLITWQGRRYTVVKVLDYTNFGDGYLCAFCDLIPLRG